MNRTIVVALVAVAAVAGVIAAWATGGPKPNVPEPSAQIPSAEGSVTKTAPAAEGALTAVSAREAEQRPEPAGDKPPVSQRLDLALSIYIKLAVGASVFVQGDLIEIELRLSNKTAEREYLRNREMAQGQLPPATGDAKDTQPVKRVPPPELIQQLPPQDYGFAGSVNLQLTRKAEDGKPDEAIWQQKQWNGYLASDRKQLERMTEIAERPLFAIWRLKPDVTRGLAPGRYELVARYDTAPLDNGRNPRGDLVAKGEFRVMAANIEDR